MATVQGAGEAPGKGDQRFGRNLGLLVTRLRRRRHPSGGPAARSHWLVIGGGAIAAAVAIAILLIAVDRSAVGWAGDLPRTIRSFFRVVTRFGQSDWLLIPSAIAIVLLLAGDWTAARRRIAAAWAEIAALVGFFFTAVAGAGLLTDVVKWTVGRSRPLRLATDGVLTLQPISFDAPFVSFPSGHATTAAAAALAITLMMRRYNVVTALVIVFGGLICLSRVVVKAHFPSDVIAGIFVGSAFTFALAHFLGRTGVAFQVQADGSLLARTTVFRGVIAERGGLAVLGDGLRRALSGKRDS